MTGGMTDPLAGAVTDAATGAVTGAVTDAVTDAVTGAASGPATEPATPPDETLMAYADGELDEAGRHAVEAAMRCDAAVARRVEQFRLQRAALGAAFAPALEETPPARLLRPLRAAKVVQLDAVRADRMAAQAAREKAARRRFWFWPGLLAATLLLGLLLGRFGSAVWLPDETLAQAGADGVLAARGALAVALSQRVAGAAPGELKVTMGISFVSNQGNYCRAFVVDGGAQDLAGLACRSGAQWLLPVLTQRLKTAGASAAEAVPAVQEAIEARIDSAALDARAEQEALRHGWQRAPSP